MRITQDCQVRTVDDITIFDDGETQSPINRDHGIMTHLGFRIKANQTLKAGQFSELDWEEAEGASQSFGRTQQNFS